MHKAGGNVMQIKKKKSNKRNVSNNNKPCCRKPAGCVACGNPAYPNCKLSCPMFDD